MSSSLHRLYGAAYQDGQHHPFPDGPGFGRGHWLNLQRWHTSAKGIVNALDGMRQWATYRVLDLGCGRGVLTSALNLTGVVFAIGVDVGDAVSQPLCAVGDAAALPLGERAFDAVVALDVLEHLPTDRWPALYAEIARVLEPGGVVLATVPTKAPSFMLDSSAGLRHHYASLEPWAWAGIFDSFGYNVALEGAALAKYGPPFSYGENNYPFALERRAL